MIVENLDQQKNKKEEQNSSNINNKTLTFPQNVPMELKNS